MLRTRHLTAAIAAAMLFAGTAQAADKSPFDNVVVFGDSLSDAGQFYSTSLGTYSKFTTNPGNVTVQNVANGYGINLQPSRVGGSDYAYGGAGVVTDDDGPSSTIPTLTQQVNSYLANGAKADRRSLYMVWGGANDIFYHSTQYGIGQIFPGAGETQAEAVANINAAATQELALITQLKQAGAKYVVVFNLPNIGATPEAASDASLIPGIQSFLTSVSQSYNQVLNAGIGATGANVLPVNTYAVLNEVMANPAKYGFVNVTTPACTTSSSQDCNGSTLVAPNANQNYLFADGVHPTTAAHAIFGQVVLSELRAPGQVSLLGEAQLADSTAQTKAVRSQMVTDSKYNHESADDYSASRLFANVNYGQQRFNGNDSSPHATSDNVNLTIGADMRVNDNISAGAALGLGHNNADVAGGGGYKLEDISALGFVTYHNGPGYVGGYGEFGHSHFSSIDRSFALGPSTRNESGSTSGSFDGVGLTGGWWFGGEAIQHGPFANLEWQDIRIDGYDEHSGDSTAMWFGSQRRQALIGTLGWRLQGQWQLGSVPLTPYAELAWNHDSKGNPRDITSGLTTLNGSFSLSGFIPDKNWGSADLGLIAMLTDKVSIWFDYSGHFSDNSQKYNSVNLGMKYNF